VQGLLGPDSVFTAALGGGRGPAEQGRLIPWGDKHDPAVDPAAPWPGRLPAPSPATVPPEPWPAVVHGASGDAVGWTARGRLTECPDVVVVTDRPARRVLRWAGPWPADKPWGTAGDRRAVRIQVIRDESEPGGGETALLLHGKLSDGALLWTVEGLLRLAHDGREPEGARHVVIAPAAGVARSSRYAETHCRVERGR
jgi:protein ImuB